MTVNCMREHIAQVYDSPRWKDRAMHLMPDNQVIAVYHTMLERGKLPIRRKKTKGPRCEQISIFDMMKEEIGS